MSLQEFQYQSEGYQNLFIKRVHIKGEAKNNVSTEYKLKGKVERIV